MLLQSSGEPSFSISSSISSKPMTAAYRRGLPSPDRPATVIERKVERRTPAGRLISATKCKTVYFGKDPDTIDAIVASQSHSGIAEDDQIVKKTSPFPTGNNGDVASAIFRRWQCIPSYSLQRKTADECNDDSVGWPKTDVLRRSSDDSATAAVVVDIHSRVKVPTVIGPTPMMPPPYQWPDAEMTQLERKPEEPKPTIYNYRWEPRRIKPFQDHSMPSTPEPLPHHRYLDHSSKASQPLRNYYAAPVLSTDDEQSSGSAGTSRVKQSRLMVVRRSVCECKMADAGGNDATVEELLVRQINACRQRVYQTQPLRVDAALNAAAHSLATQIALHAPRQSHDDSDLVDAFNVWTGRRSFRLLEAAEIVNQWRREMDDQVQRNYRIRHVYGDDYRIRKSAHNFERTDLRRVGVAFCRVASSENEDEEEDPLTIVVVVYGR